MFIYTFIKWSSDFNQNTSFGSSAMHIILTENIANKVSNLFQFLKLFCVLYQRCELVFSKWLDMVASRPKMNFRSV